MTQGPFNASSFRIELAGATAGTWNILSREKEVKLSFTSEKIDVTSKDSVGWGEFIGGLKSWKGSGSGFVEFTPAAGKANIQALLDEFLTGDRLVQARFTTHNTGDIAITGLIFLENVEISATHETGCEMSFSFIGSGAPTVAPFA
jgi:predicted secreted protein